MRIKKYHTCLLPNKLLQLIYENLCFKIRFDMKKSKIVFITICVFIGGSIAGVSAQIEVDAQNDPERTSFTELLLK